MHYIDLYKKENKYKNYGKVEYGKYKEKTRYTVYY